MAGCPQKKINTVTEQFQNRKPFPAESESICVAAFNDSAPPWRNPQLWAAAAGTLAYLMHRHSKQLDQAKETAGRINSLLSSADDLLDRLGQKTCARCCAPCCRVADVSYDFRDLLFIHLTGQDTPPGQPRRSSGETCRYLGAAGCLIPRLQRPWICTWYICADQKMYLEDHQEIPSDLLLPAIADIGVLRKKMENLFIAAVAAPGDCL